MTIPRSAPSLAHLVPTAAGAAEHAGRAAVASPCARELAAALRDGDPMRASFDTAVRRFVRAERADGRDLDTILASVAAILRAHVEPSLPPERRDALQRATAWFTVSEYHRAD